MWTAVLRPDLGMSVEVTQGGLANLTQVRIQRFFLGHRSEENYIVKVSTQVKPGAPRLYVGDKMQLAVQLMIMPKDNKYPATLTMHAGKEVTSERLVCQLSK